MLVAIVRQPRFLEKEEIKCLLFLNVRYQLPTESQPINRGQFYLPYIYPPIDKYLKSTQPRIVAFLEVGKNDAFQLELAICKIELFKL